MQQRTNLVSRVPRTYWRETLAILRFHMRKGCVVNLEDSTDLLPGGEAEETPCQGFAPSTTVDIRNEIVICVHGTGMPYSIGRISFHMSQECTGARPCMYCL